MDEVGREGKGGEEERNGNALGREKARVEESGERERGECRVRHEGR